MQLEMGAPHPPFQTAICKKKRTGALWGISFCGVVCYTFFIRQSISSIYILIYIYVMIYSTTERCITPDFDFSEIRTVRRYFNIS